MCSPFFPLSFPSFLFLSLSFFLFFFLLLFFFLKTNIGYGDWHTMHIHMCNMYTQQFSKLFCTGPLIMWTKFQLFIMSQYLHTGYFLLPRCSMQCEVSSFPVCIVYPKYLYCYTFLKFRRLWGDDLVGIYLFLSCHRKFGLMPYALSKFTSSEPTHPHPFHWP